MTEALRTSDERTVEVGFCFNSVGCPLRKIQPIIDAITEGNPLPMECQTPGAQVEVLLGDIRAIVYQRGCLDHCDEGGCSVAEICMNDDNIEYIPCQNLAEFQAGFKAVCSRSPEDWNQIHQQRESQKEGRIAAMKAYELQCEREFTGELEEATSLIRTPSKQHHEHRPPENPQIQRE